MKKPHDYSKYTTTAYDNLRLGVPEDDQFVKWFNRVAWIIVLIFIVCVLAFPAEAQCEYDPYCSGLETHRQERLQRQQHWNDYNSQREMYRQQPPSYYEYPDPWEDYQTEQPWERYEQW